MNLREHQQQQKLKCLICTRHYSHINNLPKVIRLASVGHFSQVDNLTMKSHTSHFMELQAI